jgi:two-component system cell cycle response regulator DivK
MSMSETASMTVLVVDDFADSREVLRKRLELNGYRVVEAADGEQAVETARLHCPDLILMDLHLPLLDGLTAAKRIRAVKGLCEGVPIIAVTAYHTYGMREAALEAGCDDYLVKPLDERELNATLGRLLPGWRG